MIHAVQRVGVQLPRARCTGSPQIAIGRALRSPPPALRLSPLQTEQASFPALCFPVGPHDSDWANLSLPTVERTSGLSRGHLLSPLRSLTTILCGLPWQATTLHMFGSNSTGMSLPTHPVSSITTWRARRAMISVWKLCGRSRNQ
jgi:hypothetical protein